MHVFISAGEPSGDLHGANLIRSLQAHQPDIRISAFGGPKMAATGAEMLYPLTDLAVMWIGRALANLPTFFRVARQAKDHFLQERPDAVVLIDYPGFHWHIAKRARQAGIPVYYFVPPQLWAWAGWRVRKMRKSVNTVLTALPFEDDWYRTRGVNTEYVGHPYFDELDRQQLDQAFIANLRDSGRPVLTLLPGSRTQEVHANLPTIIAAAQRIRAQRPDVQLHVAAFHDRHAEMVKGMLAEAQCDAQVHVGRTPELIDVAYASLAVSGSVSLELMVRLTPTVIVYRMHPVMLTLGKMLKRCRYITLVNMLGDRELFPEYPTSGDVSTEMAGHVLEWLEKPETHAQRVAELRELRDRAAIPGACDRAAAVITRGCAQASKTRRAA